MHTRRIGRLAAAAQLWLAAAAPASAHPQYALSTINRYSKLALQPRGQVRLIFTIMVGDAPAFELRRGADRDGDGRVSPAEGAALGRELLARASAGLTLQLDGRAVPLDFAEPTLGLAGDAVAPSAFSIDTSLVLAAPAGAPHELRYEDRAELPPIGEVEILVEEGPGVRLLESCQGAPRPGQPERVTAFRHYGPPPSSLSDRSVTLRFSEAPPPPPPRPRPRWPWPAAGAAGALLLALAARRRGERRSASDGE